MNDKFRIDSHKLLYHPQKVSDWLNNKLIYPIYLDISPSGTCNHRCLFCCMDFRGYKPIFLDKNVFEKRMIEASNVGVKALLFAGEGEPLLNKDLSYMINSTKNMGIDVALTTNGSLMNENFIDKSLESISWIKVSCAAGSNETHKKVHRGGNNDFDKILNNLEYALTIKENNNYSTVLGMQFILLPDNEHEVEMLAEKVKNIGLDYLIIKPYAQSRFGISDIYKDVTYNKYLELSESLKKFNDNNFNVIFRMTSMSNWNEKYRGYDKCLCLPFSANIDCQGNVWACCVYYGDKNLYYGNIYKNTFEEIWNSEDRRKSLEYVDTKLDLSKCQINCRMDKINKYLWDLKHPIEHVNFI